MKKKYTNSPWIDGPQGIYWIGRESKIFFIGREHYGWYGESKWPEDIPSVCFAPLEFAYFTVPSMGSYWGIVKDIMVKALGVNLENWDEAASSVAFSNACKCLTDNGTLQWNLHQQCLKHGFVEREISIVGAPVTVMFTRAYEISSKIFSGRIEPVKKDEEFIVSKIDSQIVVECAHPGRQSNEWRNRLVVLIKEFLKKAEPSA
jgi:hypothetical protein